MTAIAHLAADLDHPIADLDRAGQRRTRRGAEARRAAALARQAAASAFVLRTVPQAVEDAAAEVMRATRPRGAEPKDFNGPRPPGERAMEALARIAAMPQPVERNAALVRALGFKDHSGLSNVTNNLSARGLLDIERRPHPSHAALLRVTAEGYAALGGNA